MTKRVVNEWFWDQNCIVCCLEIKPDDAVAICPMCGAIGHVDHFLEWLKIKAICPNCMRPLRERDLRKV